MKKLLKKLKSAKGESLAEMLVALLFVALALIMMATMINSASRITMQSRQATREFYSGLNTLDNYASGSEATASFKDSSGNAVSIGAGADFKVTVSGNGKDGNDAIYRYSQN